MGLEEARVRSALWLGHPVRGEDLLIAPGAPPAALLLGRSVGREHLHVPRVGRRGPEHHRRGPVAAEYLAQQGKLELTEAGAAQFLVEEERPQAAVLDLLLERVGEG